jgi:carbon-monoxide dehydrogenase medium subunit
MLALLLDATLHVVSPAGPRSVAARDFFLGPLTVDLASDEIVTRIVLPKLPPATGWGFAEVARRSGDFALAAVAVTLSLRDGAIVEARIAMTGIDDTAKRASEAEALLAGRTLTPDLIGTAAAAARAGVNPPTDLHASSDYRRHLVGVLVGRALADAWRRARGEKS